MALQWQQWGELSDCCGDDVEVWTSTGKENLAYDGDKARCVGCKMEGVVVVYGDDCAGIRWSDE